MIKFKELPELTSDPFIEDLSGLWRLSDWLIRPLGEDDERVRYWWCDDGIIEIGLEVRRLAGTEEDPFRWYVKVPRVKGTTVGRSSSAVKAEYSAMCMLEEMLLYPQDFKRQVSERAYEGMWVPELAIGALRLLRWHRTTPGNAKLRYMRSWVNHGQMPRSKSGHPPGAMVRDLGDHVSWTVDVPGVGRDRGYEKNRDDAFAACDAVLMTLGCERSEEV